VADSNLSNEIVIVACGYPANEMAGQLNRLIKKFGHDKVQEAATGLIESLTLVAHVMETYPKEYMSRPMKDIPSQLQDWACGKRKRAAELRQDIRDFKRALAETGFDSS